MEGLTHRAGRRRHPRYNVIHDGFFSFIKHLAVLKLVYVTDAVLKPALALSLPLSFHSRADTAITPAVFLLSLLMYSRASLVACLFICIPPGFGAASFVLIDEISSHEKCVIYMRLVCFFTCFGVRVLLATMAAYWISRRPAGLVSKTINGLHLHDDSA